MPVSAYSQHKDKDTGEVVWIPQLFPHARGTGDISSEEIEGWLKTGALPRDIYESDLRDREKMEEIRRRLQNGEQVLSSELPTTPWSLTEYMLKNKARIYGEDVLKRIFSSLTNEDPDIVWLSFVKEALTSIASEDPQAIHQYIARKTLKEKYNIEDPRAVDILARDLVERFGDILNTLSAFKHPAFENPQLDPIHLSDHLKHKNAAILQPDADFIRYLKKLGKKGKELAGAVEKNSKALFKQYEESGHSTALRREVWGLWIPREDQKEAPFLSVLCQSLWEEKGGKLWHRGAAGHPSLVKPVIEGIIPILSPKKQKTFAERNGDIICYHDGTPLVSAPAVDQNMISAFQKGIRELSTLTGHKLLRWQVNTGFERWAEGNSDPRSIEIEGGYSRIAEMIKCCNPREIARIREILHAQAHGKFIFSDGSYGNMLQLRITGLHHNKEPSKINIVLGDMLLPNYVCQLKRSDRLLIPIGDLPPLHGSPNSHAAQAQLQLLVFKELSNQSVRLVQEGSVIIKIDQWKELAQEAGLSPDKVELVLNHWCQPDLFNCFLERQGDEYRLASYYNRALKFLEDQGKGRIINSQRGKRSVEKKGKKLKVTKL